MLLDFWLNIWGHHTLDNENGATLQKKKPEDKNRNFFLLQELVKWELESSSHKMTYNQTNLWNEWGYNKKSEGGFWGIYPCQSFKAPKLTSTV